MLESSGVGAMRSFANQNNNSNNYGSTSLNDASEQDDSWNDDEVESASLLNHSSNDRNSIRGSLLIHLDNLNHVRQSIRNSAGTLLRQSVTLSFGGRQCSVRDSGGTATIPTEFFNLVKNLVGAGMLAIPVSNEHEEER